MLGGQPKLKGNLPHRRAALSDAELDALWKTIDLNESKENREAEKTPSHKNSLKPKSSSLNQIKFIIEKYIPGGRFFLHSFYFPIWKINLSVTYEWQAQLQTILDSLVPNKISKTYDHLKNNYLPQLFFTYSPRGTPSSPQNQKETITNLMLKQSSKKHSN